MRSTLTWLDHYPAEVAPTYAYPKQNLAQFLLDTSQKFPDRPALYFMGKTINYVNLLEACYRFANGLTGLGLKKGDRVAIMLPNIPQTVIAFYGTLLAGGIVVNTNPLYMEGELRHQLNDSGSKFMVTLDLLLPRIRKVKSSTPLQHVIVTSIKDYLPFPKNVLYGLKQRKEGNVVKLTEEDHAHVFTEFVNKASGSPILSKVNAVEDTAVLQYTGGTTGVAKGVMLTHYNLVANTLQTSHWNYNAEEGKERFLGAIPIFHVFGLTVLMSQSVLIGGMLILVPKFEIEQVLKTIDKMKPTVFPGAPTMYIGLINHKDINKYDLSSIQVCISGSAPLPLEVQERFEEITGGKLIEGYGLTEASPVTHANNIWGKRKIGKIGIPFPDTEARVVDSNTGTEVATGEIGEIIIRGPQIMKGYWNRPEESSMVLRNGWLYTGDLATQDEDGFFAIVDRKKDLIIASGFNIYPREIEEVLYEHPYVKDACAVGVPDQYRGETVKAFIVLKDNAPDVTEAELEAWCREHLAAFKVPRKFEFRETLPKTIVGKVLRRKLLEEESTKTIQQ
ncbi:long-chain fatty acid--CoA ligase [Paenibacillus swuensis]|uniref:Long-chain fatty acid--CoA ligase n=1 Tax=Paenibacillus swuensis TaxID=1178515 RepID=A0A172TQA2_9BACL|nr:long-chain fatty acid--CoA ligase [Paenibacillus swuensis]ANE48997.1 long-chain fatty acid--CoA ligase [Paenibacillus swuensis]